MTDDEVEEYLTPAPMTLEYQAAVGRVALWAAWLEQEVAMLCAELLSGDYASASAVTDHMQASQMIDLASRLVKVSRPGDPVLRSETAAALADARVAFTKRNTLLHGLTGSALQEGLVVFSSRKKGPQGVPALFALSDIDAVARSLQSLCDTFSDITARTLPARDTRTLHERLAEERLNGQS